MFDQFKACDQFGFKYRGTQSEARMKKKGVPIFGGACVQTLHNTYIGRVGGKEREGGRERKRESYLSRVPKGETLEREGVGWRDMRDRERVGERGCEREVVGEREREEKRRDLRERERETYLGRVGEIEGGRDKYTNKQTNREKDREIQRHR